MIKCDACNIVIEKDLTVREWLQKAIPAIQRRLKDSKQARQYMEECLGRPFKFKDDICSQ